MRTLIRGGRLIDPYNGIDGLQDLYLAEGRVIAIGSAPEDFRVEQTIDAQDQIVCPGLIDLQARLREPGQEQKGTIATETLAAAKGGITTLCCPPDTLAIIDTPAVVDLIAHREAQYQRTRILPLGALTQGLQGLQLAEMGILQEAGCVGVSNGLMPITNSQVMRQAMEYAATLGITLFLYPRDPWLGIEGCCHEGIVSARLGLAGIPETAETVSLARDLLLIEQTGVQAHFCHLSSARAVRMVRQAQTEGLPISADVTAYHLHLTEHDIGEFDSQCHVIPPLRTLRDRDALHEGLREGTFSAICSDHQPHEVDAKLGAFPITEPGISGLETLLPLSLRLTQDDILTLPEVIAYLTCQPAQVLGIEGGHLAPGQRADICIFDPHCHWIFKPEEMASQGKNTPFGGWEFQGRVTYTLLEGRVVFAAAAETL
ncbi:dihydroorotase [Nitrosococcus watsonii]|uniref:Dihydroorotase, multifunctional complex type n=1 Tax=Nitrosococcus watsoni (strain C-113) TaxID=105559 RepID=D8KAS8_NITWC|nr:dihydroorotase [Nitrosococcus watsonii]ADJ29505.1 dihydroorotase, multifunctional complex type [Nitrosococcus watsonii C-113]